MKRDLIEKASRIKLFLMDVDGVLTDGRINYDEEGREFKSFHIHDGHGIKMLKEAGIKTGIISGRKSKAAEARAKELSIDECYMGVTDKTKKFEEILKRLGLKEIEVAYIGDDLPDLPLLKRVGFSLSVSNGIDEVKDQVDWVTKKSGGLGGVREAADFILSARAGQNKAKPVGFLQG
ncbi:MAG: KdsC family phosphatase [Nitrospiria bacterium]